MNAPEPRTALAVQQPAFDLSPRNFEQALTFAGYLAESDLVPKDFRGKPGNCLIGMQWGAELGLKPLQALQGIAVINGRPNLWGDAMLAIVRASPLCEYVVEGWEADGTAFCKAKRRGEPEQVRTYSDHDAKLAGLLGKQGPWQQSPKRMKQLRARSFALRDVFADLLRGMHMAEESADIPPPAERHMGAVEEVAPPAAPARPELPAYEQAAFDKNLPAWTRLVADGKKTAPDLLAMLSTKATFSEEQKARVLSLKRAAPPPADPAPPAATNATDAWVADMEAAEGSEQ